MSPEMQWDELTEIENYLKSKLKLGLSTNSYNSMHSSKIPIESKTAWSAYQHLRRELAYYRMGKDPSVDRRDWTTMVAVDYDEPFNAHEFTTEIEKQ